MKQLTVLFLLKGDSILLAMKKRGFGKDRWNGVGGKVEPGESVEEAAIRECQEEIEVTPITITEVASITFDENHTKGRELVHVSVFISTKWRGEPKETEEMAPQWFAFKDIPYDRMWADDPYWLPKILEGKKLRCTFTLDDNDQVTNHTVDEITSF